MKTVAILGSMNGATYQRARAIFTEAGCEVITGKSFTPEVHGPQYAEKEVSELLSEADVVFTAGGRAPITRASLSPQPKKLRGIVTCSLGYNQIDLNACTDNNILVSNSPVETNYEGVVQHTTLLILMLIRKVDFFRQWAGSGERWAPAHLESLPTLLDSQTTLGVIGFGRTGFRVARLFKSMFRTDVLVYDPYVADEKAQFIGAEVTDDLDDLLRKSDIITLHVFLSDETRHLIGRRELGLMKKTAYLVNTCRGPVVDQDALIEALQNRSIAGAALDVAEVEPLPTDSPLHRMENVVITSHVAGISSAHVKRGTEFAANNVLRLLTDQLPKAILNPEAIPKWSDKFGIEEVRYGGTVYYGSRKTQQV